MMRKYFFDENSEKDLREKGYTVVKMLSSEEVNILLDEMKKLKPADDFGLKGDIDFHSTLADSNYNYRREAYELIYSIFSPQVKRIFIDCEILAYGFSIKNPGGKGEVPLHQDWTLTYNPEDINYNSWCSLTDVEESNGALFIIEGSHKIAPNIVCPQLPQYCSDFQETLKEMSTPVKLKTGEAIIWNPMLIHWSPNNHSQKPRIAAGVSVMPKEMTPVFYYPIQDSSDNRLKVFEINTDFFINHNLTDILNGNINAKSVGFIQNPNRVVSESEFISIIKNGSEIRRKLYFSDEKTKAKVSVLNKIKSLFGI